MKFTNVALMGALLVSVSGAAFAKDPTDGKSEDIAVEKVICQQLYVHKPADDVAYKPGVDVDGNPVAPADLPGAQMQMADYLEVPLTVDLAQKLSQPVPEGVKMDSIIGNLRLYKDGRITYNGSDVLPQASTMCGGELKTEEAAVIAPPAPVYTPEEPKAGSVAPSATTNPYPEDEDQKGKPKLAKKPANFLVQPAAK